MRDRDPPAAELPPLRGTRRVLALVWLGAVLLLYVAARELGLGLGP